MLIPVRLLGTSRLLSGRKVDTAELVEKASSGRNPDEILASTGIQSRYWMAEGSEVAEVGAKALLTALEEAGLQPTDLRRVILVCSSGGDVRIPATVNALLAAVGTGSNCDGFDVNNACMGFLSGLDIAARSVATGVHPVAVVTVEALSRHIAPHTPRSYFVLGDAAAAVVLGPARGKEGIVGRFAANDGAHRHTVFLGPGRGRDEHDAIEFAASSREMTRIAVGALRTAAESALFDAGLTLKEVDWFVPHQPNGAMLDHIVETMGVHPDRIVKVVREIGSVGAASIPVGLDTLLHERQVLEGQHILLFGVGAGMAYGAAVYRMGA